uniref:Uncharacterized protein n=1 Tax=Anguilla anguilla TaxID=7936 RepID=A0A0E9UNN5_ANGAN
MNYTIIQLINGACTACHFDLTFTT